MVKHSHTRIPYPNIEHKNEFHISNDDESGNIITQQRLHRSRAGAFFQK